MIATVLFGLPQQEIASLIADRMARSSAISVVTGFATPGGLTALSGAFTAQSQKLRALVVGAATYPGFAAFDAMLAAGVAPDRLHVHLGHTSATRGRKNPFARYHPMLHSKVYYMELPDEAACVFIGSASRRARLASGLGRRSARARIDHPPRFGRTGTMEHRFAMVDFRTGDVLRTDAEALVNTVNCVGIMGRGVALQFKKAFPANFKAYQAACKRQEVQPGRMFVFETGYVGNPKFIINFPTKRHWRGKSRIEDIDSGLRALADVIRERQIRSVAMPPLGSGLGGLHWPDVRRRIEEFARALPDVSFTVFEPRREDAVAEVAVPIGAPPKMTPGRAALVGLMRRYLGGLLDPVVTLLEIHKLMYFMQEAGEPLRLRYVKAPYGPYAENLSHVLRAIDGYFVAGYGDGGESPGKELTLVPGAVEEAAAFLADNADVEARFSRVADLVEGFETPFGLELLSTVHWVASHEHVQGTDDLLRAVYSWADRKKQFTVRQIELAARTLAQKGWAPRAAVSH